MKYVRKVVGLVIAVAFIASVIIGVGIIFSVKNVNISLQSYTYPEVEVMTEEEKQAADGEIEDFRQSLLSEYRGTLLGFVDVDELSARFDDTNYILENIEKAYPCTLNLTIKERRESFCVRVGENSYNTYDSYGTLMREGVSKDDSINNIDKAPNVAVSVENAADIKAIADMASAFSEEFSALRSVVESIGINEQTGHIVFKLHCGISIRISDFRTLTKAKMRAAHEKFISLAGEEKLSGTIVVTVRGSGDVVAERFEDLT